MADIKHVGRIKTNGRKVLVAYRTLPGDSDSALIIQTENLRPEEHDALISLVESNSGQSAYEFAEVLGRSHFPNGAVMLNRLHSEGKLTKVKTSNIEMTPNMRAVVGLDQLNQIIAEQKGISVNDLALGNSNVASEIRDVAKVIEVPEAAPAVETVQEVLSDSEIAKGLRSQADAMYKEAAKLRAEAEVLSPTKKKITVKDSA